MALRINIFTPIRSSDSATVKTHGQSSRLHSKKNFFLGGWGLAVSGVISGGLLGHLGPLCLALGANR